MTKTKIISFAAALALMFMGVGYAYWSQNIPINISGRLGTFHVGVVGAAAVRDDGSPQDPSLASARRDGDSVVLTAAKLLPNGARHYTVTFKNTGDANAVLDKVELTPISGDPAVLSCVGIRIENKPRVELGSKRTVNFNRKLASGDSLTIDIDLTLAEDAVLTQEEQTFEVGLKAFFVQD